VVSFGPQTLHLPASASSTYFFLFLSILLVGSLDGWAVCREDLIWLLGAFNSSREIYILFSETRRCVVLYFPGVRHHVVIDLGDVDF
jgi:hypothetical protein